MIFTTTPITTKMGVKVRRCFVCGVTHSSKSYKYYDFVKIFGCYQVCSKVDICERCAYKADSFVDYYGKKKKRDVRKLFKFLRNGVLVLEEFSALMNAGYY